MADTDEDKAARLRWLAVAQSMKRVIDEAVGTGNPDNLRGEVDRDARSMYRTMGTTKRDIIINGQKVGYLSSSINHDVVVTDEDAFSDFAEDQGWFSDDDGIDLNRLDAPSRGMLISYVEEHYPEALTHRHELNVQPKKVIKNCHGIPCTKDGEQVPGVEFRDSFGHTTIRDCYYSNVSKAMGRDLAPVVNGLLTGVIENV